MPPGHASSSGDAPRDSLPEAGWSVMGSTVQDRAGFHVALLWQAGKGSSPWPWDTSKHV